MKQKTTLALFLFGSLWVGGWGSVSGESIPATPAVKSVTVSCSPTSITAEQTSTCSAIVNGGGYSPFITWSAKGGTVSPTGVFTPAEAGTATVTASSAQSEFTGISGSAAVTVEGSSGYIFFFFAKDHEAIEFWVKFLGVLAAVLALFLTWRTHAERAFFEMIDQLYALPHALEANLVNEWYLAHLWCTEAQEYEQTKKRITSQIARDYQKFPEFLVREKLFAIQIFLVYEQIYFQWANSAPYLHRKPLRKILLFFTDPIFQHRRRKAFLWEILSFFHGRFFSNPRLTAFLEEDETGRTFHLEERIWKHIKNETAKEMAKSKEIVTPDFEGPFQASAAGDADVNSVRKRSNEEAAVPESPDSE